MALDNAIRYNAKLEEVRQGLAEIKKIHMDVSEYSKMVDEIDEVVKSKVAECYDRFKGDDSSTFLLDAINNTYANSIKELDSIMDYINNSYDDYFKIGAAIKDLKSKASLNNISNIDEIVEEAKYLLIRIKNTSTINYEEERYLVENAYKVVYEVLKLESIADKSSLLDEIKEDDIDRVYISRLINKDIDKLKSNSSINDLVVELNKNGVNSKNYLDSKLIRVIICLTNKKYMDYLKESYVSKFNMIHKDTKELEDTNKHFVDLNKRIYYLKHGSISPMLRTFMPFLLISSMGLPFLFNHDSFIEKDYKKTIEEYDSTSDTTTVIENYEDNEEGITAKVYTPWDYNEKKHQYERECKEYSINDENVELEDIIYAINNDEAISKNVNKTKEVAEIKTKDMIYEGNQYVITKVTVSDTDYIVTEEAKKEADAVSGVLFGLFVVLGGCVGVLRLPNYLDSISEIINEKKHLKELKKKIKTLKVSSDDYQIDINNLIMQHDYLPFELTERDQNEEAFEYLYSNTVKEESFEDIYKKISNKNR